jgi:hypothetical protein
VRALSREEEAEEAGEEDAAVEERVRDLAKAQRKLLLEVSDEPRQPAAGVSGRGLC